MKTKMATLKFACIAWIVKFTILWDRTSADYDCLCNYNVELSVYSKPTTKSSLVGYMYEFDCKELLSVPNIPSEWRVCAYEHKYGYVRAIDGNIEIQLCAGSPPDGDMIISTVATPLTSRTSAPSSSSTTTSTTAATTTTASTTTTSTTATTVSSTTTTAPTTKTTTVKLRTNATTMSTTPKPTQLSSILTGKVTTPTLITGNTNLCPQILHRYTLEDKGALTQYGDYCYEIVPIRAIWSRAESDCIAKGGDLFHVDNQGLQDFIYRWIKSYKFDHAVWTGLHDVRTEEHFEWISGDHVVYTNFHPDRKGNLASHYNEDCVLFVPYAPYYGQWDDVICGSITLLGDVGQQNPFICEFPIHSHHTLQIIG